MKQVLLVIFLLFSFYTYAGEFEPFEGQVVGVHDGDSITVLDRSKTQFKVRLAEIDAPELRQDYGARSKQMLSDLVFGKSVVVIPTDKDRYGRLVSRIEVDGQSINKRMVEQGGAWVYREYLFDTSLLESEEKARSNKLGLWSVSTYPMPPWEWRKQKRSRKN